MSTPRKSGSGCHTDDSLRGEGAEQAGPDLTQTLPRGRPSDPRIGRRDSPIPSRRHAAGLAVGAASFQQVYHRRCERGPWGSPRQRTERGVHRLGHVGSEVRIGLRPRATPATKPHMVHAHNQEKMPALRKLSCHFHRQYLQWFLYCQVKTYINISG